MSEAQREISLTEFAGQLHPDHRVNKELKAMLEAYDRLKAENERLREGLTLASLVAQKAEANAERWRTARDLGYAWWEPLASYSPEERDKAIDAASDD